MHYIKADVYFIIYWQHGTYYYSKGKLQITDRQILKRNGQKWGNRGWDIQIYSLKFCVAQTHKTRQPSFPMMQLGGIFHEKVDAHGFQTPHLLL